MSIKEDYNEIVEEVKKDWKVAPMSKKVAFCILITFMMAIVLFFVGILISMMISSFFTFIVVFIIIAVGWSAWRLSQD